MESLLELAVSLNIEICYFPLDKGLFGLYSPASNTIYLDTKLLQPKYYKLHRCILAEEIGHAITGTTGNALSMHSLHINYSTARKITEDEKRALCWATEKLVPTQELTIFLSEGFYNCEALSEYFGVTTWFMFRALEFLQLNNSIEEVRLFIKLAKISCI